MTHLSVICFGLAAHVNIFLAVAAWHNNKQKINRSLPQSDAEVLSTEYFRHGRECSLCPIQSELISLSRGMCYFACQVGSILRSRDDFVLR